MTYNDLKEALQVFGLGEQATLQQIKSRHRELVKRYHPDWGTAEDAAGIRQVNAAYRIIHAYVSEYSFAFSEEEFYQQNPEERLRRQFMEVAQWR